MTLLLLMMMVAAEARLPYSVPRVNMIQRRSCYYTPFTKELTCRCTDTETNTFLKLRLMFFIKEKGQEVRSVMVRDCSDLMVGLDLTAVNPLDLPIRFKNCGTVSFSYIKFDNQFSGGQKLSLGMENVNSVRLEDMDVKDAIQIKTNRVKELVLRRNRFTHVPLPGLEIVAADRLVITDNYFHRISAGSVDVKSAKEVEVINNQFSVNAIQVVRSSEGSRLYISCNRLLGEVQSPECVTTSTTTTTTAATTRRSSTTTTLSTTSSTRVLVTTAAVRGFEMSAPVEKSGDVEPTSNSALSEELLIGLVAGVAALVLILLVVVVILCCRRKQAKRKTATEVAEDAEKLDILVEKEEGKDSGNNSADSLPVEVAHAQEAPEAEQTCLLAQDEDHLVEAAKPRFSAPVWLDDLQNNKIFNKQRSINTELQQDPPARTSVPFPVRSISEIIDSEEEEEVERSGDSVDSSPVSSANNNNQSKSNGNANSGSMKQERKAQE